MPRTKWAVAIGVVTLVALTVGPGAFAQRKAGGGGVDKTVTGPGGKAAADVDAVRMVDGNQASSTATVTGSRGKAVTASGSSEIKGNTAEGAGTATGPGGKSATGTGQATKTKSGVAASGSATGPRGKSVSATGSASKQGDTVSGSGTVTGPKGQEATVSGNGSQTEGSVTVETSKGTSTATWDRDSATATGAKGKSRTVQRR